MSKKIEKYKKQANRIVRTLKMIGISVIILAILVSIAQYVINKSMINEENQNLSSESSDYEINVKNNTVVYKDNIKINISIKNYEAKCQYKLKIDIDGTEIIQTDQMENDNTFNINFNKEGKKEISITIFKDDAINYNNNLNIFYIKPYEKQFLDELSTNGISAHFALNIDGEKSIELLKSMGISKIRDDIIWYKLEKTDGTFDFSKCDEWINNLYDNDIELYAILINPGKLIGDDKKISNDEELSRFVNFAKIVANRYPQIMKYEVLNEPNLDYLSNDDMKYYSKAVSEITSELKKINPRIQVIGGATAAVVNDEKNKVSSNTFINNILNNTNNKINNFSVHEYDNTSNASWVGYMLKQNNKIVSQNGGFNNTYMSEYGASTYKNGFSEEQQAFRLVKYSIVADINGIKEKYIYNSKNIGNDLNNSEHNFGIINYNYTPKLSYYALKNFYENTNGAEYIGAIEYEDGIKGYVYNKDGKPKIIIWSQNTDEEKIIKKGDFKATDIYGMNILPDEDGNIKVSTSEIYLDNVSKNYFYQAISNEATTKYDEFLEKFQDEISQVSGLKTSIENLRRQMQNISNHSSLNEQTAINLMKEHYKLGDTIIQAHKSKTLQVEYVRLSSMLDMLDEIGDSFEDLVTVSCKTRNSNLAETKKLITTAENLINNNEDLDIIYPTKILEFSKDFYEKAEYINSLEEENDIKTGLIVSKNIHSNLLAGWANEFATLYIDKYIEDNPVDIVYSATNLTNQSVTVTLKTNAQITVTNNQNSKMHTFTENGEFTFEYAIKGRSFIKKATVNNIDKISPQITGIEKGRFYIENVTPKITDENLKEVKLYKNSNWVQNYIMNSTISEDGEYKLEATDKAGNKTIITFDICSIPATINYSETNWTNKNVVATIVSNYPIKVTNNSGENTYTFNNNGTFTFDYTIKGKSYTATATVNNIDKIPPKILNVENGKLYVDKAIIPNVSDENLNEIKLYINSIQVKDYKSGNKITEEGFYRLVANDLAGNETEVKFNIMKNNSEEYKIQGKNIFNIAYNTSKKDFMKKFSNSSGYQIERNGQVLGDEENIATGDKLKIKAGDEYSLIVTGDINKDGKVNISDVIKLRRYLLLRNNLDEQELLAADCNLDGKSINISDLIKLRLIVLGKGTN